MTSNYLRYANNSLAQIFRYLFFVLYDTRYYQHNFFWYYRSSIIDSFTLTNMTKMKMISAQKTANLKIGNVTRNQ